MGIYVVKTSVVSEMSIEKSIMLGNDDKMYKMWISLVSAMISVKYMETLGKSLIAWENMSIASDYSEVKSRSKIRIKSLA